MENINFRIGTTSYIIPDDIIPPNVRYLGGKTDDIELVLFEVDDGPSNLLTPRATGGAGIAGTAEWHDLYRAFAFGFEPG